MARQHHYRRRSAQPTELDMTTFLNLMVVLVPFLLITAVFSRITIVELSLPAASGSAAQVEPKFRIEVIVRFLAVLELFKQGAVDIDQSDRFGEIEIEWTADSDFDHSSILVDTYEG